MKVQIFTDGSVHIQSNDAGFAYWITCYQFEVQRAGYAGKVKATGNAELYSIDEALKDILSRELIPIERIDVYTDSTEVIHKLTNTCKSAAFFNMMEITIRNGMRPRQIFELFKFHHIKAHTTKTDNFTHRNRWCDMMAKAYRVSKQQFRATMFDNSDILL